MKRFIQRSFKRFGIEIRRTRTARHPGEDRDLLDFITDRAIDTVLDVGANVGQFGELLRSKGYRGKIVSFEPICSEYQTLAAKAASDGNWQANNFALGANAGGARINVADASVFSSILPSTAVAANHDSRVAIGRTEAIAVRTLDECCPSLLGNVLLKIDTQGYEKQVLEGARHTLAGCKGVLMELPIVHLYEGTWQFHEAIAFMAEAGFIPAQIHPVNYHSADHVSLIEVDCLFRPHDRRLDQ